MAKVTSKLQLTVPKAIADQYGIKPGDELEWVPAGESIRVEFVRSKAKAGHELTTEERLALFDDWHEAGRRTSGGRTENNTKGNDPPVKNGAGPAKIFITTTVDSLVASLVDTNILVYCFDFAAPHKREAARDLLRKGSAKRDLLIPHQAMVEFVKS